MKIRYGKAIIRSNNISTPKSSKEENKTETEILGKRSRSNNKG